MKTCQRPESTIGRVGPDRVSQASHSKKVTELKRTSFMFEDEDCVEFKRRVKETMNEQIRQRTAKKEVIIN